MKRQVVTVVTICEERPCREYDFSTKVFSDYKRAVEWIEGQIDDLVARYALDRQTAVDGWFVQLDCFDHAIQYEAEEQDVM